MRYYWAAVLNFKNVAIPRTAVWKIQVRSDEMDTWLSHQKKKSLLLYPQIPQNLLWCIREWQILCPIAYILEEASLFVSRKGEEMLGNCAVTWETAILFVWEAFCHRHTSKIIRYCEEREFKMYEVKFVLAEHPWHASRNTDKQRYRCYWLSRNVPLGDKCCTVSY